MKKMSSTRSSAPEPQDAAEVPAPAGVEAEAIGASADAAAAPGEPETVAAPAPPASDAHDQETMPPTGGCWTRTADGTLVREASEEGKEA